MICAQWHLQHMWHMSGKCHKNDILKRMCINLQCNIYHAATSVWNLAHWQACSSHRFCEFCAGEKHRNPKRDDDHHNVTMAYLLKVQWWYNNPKHSFNEFVKKMERWLSTGVIMGQCIALESDDCHWWMQSLDHRVQRCKKMTQGLFFIRCDNKSCE